MRDDFPERTKDILARRVGMHCSNPRCWKLTSGPRDDPEKAVNIGVAAHITAAAAGGPRYDQALSNAQRSSITNAIWLCQNCAKMVDNDPQRFTVTALHQWKSLAEDTARIGIETIGAAFALQPVSDTELVRAYAQCFDRPAFQDRFHQEGSMEAFDKAIEDTIAGINTGCIRSREGEVILHTLGKSYLQNPEVRERMDVVVDLLRWIRFRYADAVERNVITFHGHSGGRTSYCVNEQELSDWMDTTRAQALKLFSEICYAVGIRPPPFRFDRGDAHSATRPTITSIQASSKSTSTENPGSLDAFPKILLSILHDLNAPLVAVRGAAEAIRGSKDAAKKDMYAQQIDGWNELMRRIVNSLATFACNGHDFRFQKTLLVRDVISPVIKSLTPLLAEKRFTSTQIHLTDLSSLPALWLDRNSFQQVFFTLLSNSIKYALPSESFRVVVRASHLNGHYLVSVCDWGIGIEKNEMDLLGKPGYRGGKARSQDIRGAGIGLAVARSISEAHGGALEITSLRSPTEFTIKLPELLAASSPERASE